MLAFPLQPRCKVAAQVSEYSLETNQKPGESKAEPRAARHLARTRSHLSGDVKRKIQKKKTHFCSANFRFDRLFSGLKSSNKIKRHKVYGSSNSSGRLRFQPQTNIRPSLRARETKGFQRSLARASGFGSWKIWIQINKRHVLSDVNGLKWKVYKGLRKAEDPALFYVYIYITSQVAYFQQPNSQSLRPMRELKSMEDPNSCPVAESL